MDKKRLPALCPKLFINFWLISDFQNQWSTGITSFIANYVRNSRECRNSLYYTRAVIIKSIMNIVLETELKNGFLSEMFIIFKINVKVQRTNLYEIFALEMANTIEWVFALSYLTAVVSY